MNSLTEKKTSPSAIFLALETLELDLEATSDDVKRAYERLSKQSDNPDYGKAHEILMSIKLPVQIGVALDDDGNPIESAGPQTAAIEAAPEKPALQSEIAEVSPRIPAFKSPEALKFPPRPVLRRSGDKPSRITIIKLILQPTFFEHRFSMRAIGGVISQLGGSE